MDLVLPVKRKWFEQIKDGSKIEEYRLDTPYWRKRLIGKAFDRVVVTLGYPRRDDNERRIARPWRGYVMKEVVSDEWNGEPKRVFAIRLAGSMFDNLTDKQIEILKRRIQIFGGFWEILCECGANTFNIRGMQGVPGPTHSKYKNRKSPTGLIHWDTAGGCDKDIIVHKWHDNFPEGMPQFNRKPICKTCGQDLPDKT